ASLPLMPEWYLAIPMLTVLAALGALWAPLLGALPVLVLAIAIPLAQAGISALHATYPTRARSRGAEFARRALTARLHLAQPIARLQGRLAHGLAPWRLRGPSRFAFPWPLRLAFWSERWRAADDRLAALDTTLRATGAVARCGGDWDSWDLEARGGALGAAR